ncbi:MULTISPECIES: ATP-binding protein [Streptomyces]|uniref:ATP-binding protein n=1 Tax=Streptomyces TaxID=1883 RepID=UPI000B8C09FD|nr:ATP-binding protein [Streptomyces sp. XY006]OXS34481.1 ATP-binding protein [Streptomyces sp. XY006]
MKQAADDEGRALSEMSMVRTAAFEGTEAIARARDHAGLFLRDLRTEHGVPVPERTVNIVQLVVSELVTNTRKYAPGPSLLTLEAREGAVAVTVWDTEPRLPVVRGADPVRVGQHGLEIVRAVCRSLEVHREPVGKRITAMIDLTPDPTGNAADARS